MRLRDVLEHPGVRLPVLAGEGELDRPAGNTYTTDLLDPARYLAGGEVVLTGMMWRREPADSEAFVAALAGAGAAALGAGEALLGPVPADLVEACLRHRLPLFAVPAEVSFREVTDRINTVLWAEREAGAVAARNRRRGLVARLAAGADLAEVWPRTGAWVLSCTGRVIVGGPLATQVPATPGAVDDIVAGGAGGSGTITSGTVVSGAVGSGRAGARDAAAGSGLGAKLAAAFLRADTLPVRCRIGDREFHLDAPALTPALGARFVAATEGGSPLEELVELAALDAARQERARQVEQRLAATLVAALATTTDPAETTAALHSCGMPTTGPYTVVVASLDRAGRGGFAESARIPGREPAVSPKPQHDPRCDVCAVVEEMAGRGGAATVVAADGARVVAVVAGGDVLAGVREGARQLAAAARGTRITAGVSETAAGVAELPAALAQARHAHDFAGERDGRVRVVGCGELASHDLLLAGVPRAARQAFADRLLAPLRAYDSSHNADLLRTLQMFLACDGSWTRCASAMHLHVNTLRYRIRRIADLTGRDLDSFADRVDLYLALRLTP
ncbi:PucR family transcriptional regulator ligand-binding domain-containing protein [Catellatospora sp. NPDC049609]|uniref:PucR family transcriptional regulator n=1 Tax=Catellatospora sp. NPDC049609 TaxID=3155505 RepID=UPI0034206E75